MIEAFMYLDTFVNIMEECDPKWRTDISSAYGDP